MKTIIIIIIIIIINRPVDITTSLLQITSQSRSADNLLSESIMA